MNPKGKLLIIGGAEDKVDEVPSMIELRKEFVRYEILRELLPSSADKKIEIVTTGTVMQAEVKKAYQKVFHEMGFHNIAFIPITERPHAQKKSWLARAEKAGVIFFTGGDQFRISTILGNTPFVDIIRERYLHERDFIIAGTSAGAMVMSQVMIAEGHLTEALMHSHLTTSSGLGLLPTCIIDTHFIKRGRFSRLAHAVIIHPEQLGIGLGEDTALIIKDGVDAECRGSGMVVIIDGREIMHSNIASADKYEAVYVENLKVHLLVKGCHFSFETRLFNHKAMSDHKDSDHE